MMVGNALQGTLLGVRAEIEGFSTETFGFISAAYFAGFLGGSYLTPILLKRVGHIRVFAAFGSLISAAFILYAAIVEPAAWFLMRLLVGFSFSGVYIVMESWINDGADNESRGQALSAYMITQMFALVAGQQLLNLGDPAGYDLFVLISVLVSIAFAPILLTVAPAPVFEAAQPMGFAELFRTAPVGFVGGFLGGGFMGTVFGMSAVYGAQIDLSVSEIALFLSFTYGGTMVMQYPIGALSDRIDRRIVIAGTSIAGAAACLLASTVETLSLGAFYGFEIRAVYLVGFLVGGFGNPVYGLVIAHVNDWLQPTQIASASGRLLFLNGVGALCGPILTGYALTAVGGVGFWMVIGGYLTILAAYTLYRMTQRPAIAVEEMGVYTVVGQGLTPVAAELLEEMSLEQREADAEARRLEALRTARGRAIRDTAAEEAEAESLDDAAEARDLEDAGAEDFRRRGR